MATIRCAPAWRPGVLLLGAALVALAACAPQQYRKDADEAAHRIIDHKQKETLGRTEPFTIERPAERLRRKMLKKQDLQTATPASFGAEALEPTEHWPEEGYPKPAQRGPTPVPPWEGGEPITLSLVQALQIGARNSREYQTRKEEVFRAALDYELEIDRFRNTYFGLIEGLLANDQAGDPTTGAQASADASLERQLESGATLSSRLGLDLARLLSSGGASSLGLVADASVTVPLLRGAGRHIVTEPMTQAEREVVYAIRTFERFKRAFSVDVVDGYYNVLQAQDRVENASNNYENQIASRRQAQALAAEGRRSQEQLDQARQAELSARNNWINARQSYDQQLDRFKLTLGLPADARIELDGAELQRLRRRAERELDVDASTPSISESIERMPPADAKIELQAPDPEGGPYEVPEPEAIRVALNNRMDLRVAEGRVFDAQRNVVFAADALKAGLALTGSASLGAPRGIGAARAPDAELRFDEGRYTAGVELDLPWERTGQRNAYRDAYIQLERAVRDLQELEDRVKLDIRNRLRTLLQQRQSYLIQVVAERVAQRRVDRTQALLDLGRQDVTVRDVNEAQAALLDAQNAVTAALIEYRVTELRLQRDMGVLQVDHQGLFDEFDPEQIGQRP